jgi:hypothetical protein
MANTLFGEGMGQPSGPAVVSGGPDATTISNSTQTGLITERAKLSTWVLNNLQRLRNFRRPYDQRRSYFYRQYIGQRDRRMFPDNLTPRSNTFVPYPKSNVDTVVSRVHDAFWSIDPPIEARPKGGTPESATYMLAVLLTCLKKAQWIQQLELAVRDCAIYGHMGIKVDWDWDYDTVTGPEPVYQMQPVMDEQGQPKKNPDGSIDQLPVINPMTGKKIQIGQQLASKKIPRACPKLRVIDIYDLLIDPDKKQKAEVSEISWGELRRQVEMNPKLYFPEAIQELDKNLAQYRELDRDGIIIRMAEFWDDTSKSVTITTFGEDADAIGWKDRRYQYRNASYSAYKRNVYNGPPILLYTGPNPFAHQRIPILDLGFIALKGDVYGIGVVESISDLTEAVNVMTNMVTDNWNMGINRRVAYDVTVDIDHDQLDMGNVPGGKVGVVGDPSRAIMPLPSFVPQEGDYSIIELYKGMIEMTSGISDFYAKGIGSAGGNRTSGGISQVINESGYIFKLFIRRFELEILQPMCEMVASMIQQFGTDMMEFSITNAQPDIPKWGYVPLESLLGNYEFDFVAANYATGKVVKQRNLMAFYNLAMQSPYALQGEFLREIALAMEIPNGNRLLKTDQQVQQESQQSNEARQQEMLMDHLLKFESKAAIEQIKKPEFMPNTSVPTFSPQVAHGAAIQAEVEQFLADTYDQMTGGQSTGSEPIHPVGRPRQSQFEGQIPGMTGGDEMRGFGQQNGANAVGNSGND